MESFEELLKESPSGYGDGLIKGKIVKKTKDEIFLDLKTKTDRPIPRSEFLPEEWETLQVGDEIEVLVQGGRTSYSKARGLVALQELKNAHINNEPIEIKVTGTVKGGYTASYKGINIFLPASQSGRNEKIVLRNSYKALVIKFEEKDNNVVCSISELEKREKERLLNKFFEDRQIGEIITGKVKTIIEKGVFVDLGGFEGFVPFSELTYKRIKSPKEYVKVGDSLTAKIIEVNSKKRKITLSSKTLEEKPWDRFLRTFKEGDKIEGIVRNMINTGVFVEIIDGVDGFLHVSEISWTERVNDPKKYFNIGDKVSCLIKSIDEKHQKISLSLREVLANPWQDFVSAHAIGSVVACKVKEVMDKGIVVSLENDLEGFIPNEYVSWNKIAETKKSLSEGMELTAKLIEASALRRKIVLSLRDMTTDPWLVAKEKIRENMEIEGVVTGFTDKLVFFEVMPDVEGVVKKSEFEKGKKEQEIKLGDKIMLLVKEFDYKNRRLSLTKRGLEIKQEKEALAELKNQNTAKVTLGDFLKR
ncbi:MAG: 30S ribosomal protein S1 [bacterium]